MINDHDQRTATINSADLLDDPEPDEEPVELLLSRRITAGHYISGTRIGAPLNTEQPDIRFTHYDHLLANQRPQARSQNRLNEFKQLRRPKQQPKPKPNSKPVVRVVRCEIIINHYQPTFLSIINETATKVGKPVQATRIDDHRSRLRWFEEGEGRKP